MNRQLRQGDVFIIATDQLPTKLTPVKHDQGHTILAYGEVTGHAHRIKSKRAELLEAEDGRRFLQVREAASDLLTKSDELTATIDGVLLSHEEHSTITIPNGTYEVRIQQEYDDEGYRAVLD